MGKTYAPKSSPHNHYLSFKVQNENKGKGRGEGGGAEERWTFHIFFGLLLLTALNFLDIAYVYTCICCLPIIETYLFLIFPFEDL